MKCPSRGAAVERGMRLTFKLHDVIRERAHYVCDTPGVSGRIVLPRSDDAPAEELTVYVEGV